MANGDNNSKDPHLGLRFWIQIDGIEVAGFSECSGITVETDVMEYKEGGNNTYTHKLPGPVKFGNITLKRGLDPTEHLYSWFEPIIQGNKPQRKNVSIMIYGPKPDQLVYKVDLRRAFPVKWVGPDLKTEAGATAIETLEIAHEGFTVTKS